MFKVAPQSDQPKISGRFRAAFSLIETVVVLFIVSVGLLGVLSLIIQNIQSQDYNKNNLVGYQLAQEGIELIRKVRDSNWRSVSRLPIWAVLPPGQYYMDYLDSAPHSYSPSQPATSLLRQDSQGFYFHDSSGTASSSGFSRVITITPSDANSLKVNCRVSWSERNRQASYDLDTLLYDWR